MLVIVPAFASGAVQTWNLDHAPWQQHAPRLDRGRPPHQNWMPIGVSIPCRLTSAFLRLSASGLMVFSIGLVSISTRHQSRRLAGHPCGVEYSRASGQGGIWRRCDCVVWSASDGSLQSVGQIALSGVGALWRKGPGRWPRSRAGRVQSGLYPAAMK